ncbi:PhzF family phenazine biosynthesis protein [Solirubrobacter sp. CPCC 204708]|uniref:PhzF family phenazine biosynthesis protein n=1 Tax=Solirubrobacter deserti TaxID=2282478 RepID=A0ABT4RRF1_9ACTN|nr:PhzF family phenazine biosynthesis isomerase [Solirubrobacter deserti]MBE2319279.1 PhzF family phenazine biosynthesis protein [Solirubrobacter deserti]MDA0141144.1 PhzF family phenazine biosynthesis protein [Solirubrobacter deserti]
MTAILSYAAFTDTPEGGNPAGVVLDARGLDETQMLKIAADLGYSETAFVVARDTPNEYDVRYFAPEAEVPFCGHATIATGVALADRDGTGTLVFHTQAGTIPVHTEGTDGAITATLTSVKPHTEDVPEDVLGTALDALGWDKRELDPALPPKIAYAGARHLVLAAKTRERLADLDYDFEALKQLMLDLDLITVDLVHREDATTFHARNPFPIGGVVEDPATGAAAAAFGNYLRETGNIEAPATVTVHQGVDMGRPSLLTITIGTEPEIRVSGRAVAM